VARAEVDDQPRRRRGRRWGTGLLVVLLLLGGLLVAADRIGARVAEDRIAAEVEQELAARDARAGGMDVAVEGVPFLTQVLRGRYESVRIRLTELTGPVGGDTVRVPSLDVRAANVRASLEQLRSGRGEAVAETVDGTATIGYDSVATLLNQPQVQLAERAGRLVVSAPLTLAGQRYTLSGEAEIRAVDGKIQLRVARLDAPGLPNDPRVQGLITAYAGQFTVTVPLPALPFGLTVREVRALPEGLRVVAQAVDVPLNAQR